MRDTPGAFQLSPDCNFYEFLENPPLTTRLTGIGIDKYLARPKCDDHASVIFGA